MWPVNAGWKVATNWRNKEQETTNNQQATRAHHAGNNQQMPIQDWLLIRLTKGWLPYRAVS